MTPLKIKITVRDKALEMQVLEQDERLRTDAGNIFHNGDMYLASCGSLDMYDPTLFIRGFQYDLDGKTCSRSFDSNADRDAYLARVKKLMSDFHVAWKAGEVEVVR